MLSVHDLHKAFGGLRAVDGASFAVRRGSITGLIGPNGAGKSTAFDLIAGALRPDRGSIRLDGEEIAGLAPHVLFEKGLARTFQIPRVFASLSVRENLAVAPLDQAGEGLWRALFARGPIARQEREIAERAEDVIAFLELGRVADQKAGELSGGQKKLVELGRVMMADPKIVFLDEIGAGVNRTLLAKIGDALLRLNRERGYTFCLIEHEMAFVSRLCDPVVVMAEGKVLTVGAAEEVKRDDRVIEAYLGRGAAAA